MDKYFVVKLKIDRLFNNKFVGAANVTAGSQFLCRMEIDESWIFNCREGGFPVPPSRFNHEYETVKEITADQFYEARKKLPKGFGGEFISSGYVVEL